MRREGEHTHRKPLMSHLNDAIVRLYDTVFDRAPDPGGLAHWNAAADAGMPLHDIAAYFVASPEFSSTYGQPDNLAFVQSLYQNVLGRPGEAAGVEAWTQQLATGSQDRAGVTAAFSECAEHIALMQGPPIAPIAAPHIFFGTIDADVIVGTDGPDRILGVSADQMTRADLTGVMIDVLARQDKGDRLGGGNGYDTLEGGYGNDTLDGGSDDDLLIGGPGQDLMFGGAGADVFRFATAADASGDAVLYFQPGIDKLDFHEVPGPIQIEPEIDPAVLRSLNGGPLSHVYVDVDSDGAIDAHFDVLFGAVSAGDLLR